MLAVQKQIRKLFFKRKKPIFDRFHQVLANQLLNLDQMRTKQLEQLNQLLTHAINNVPYFQNKLSNLPYYKSGWFDLKSLDDLNNLPLLSKTDVNEQGLYLYDRNYHSRPTTLNASGGSTGVPTKILQDEPYLIADEACLLQLKNWRNVDPYDSEIFIWGAQRDTFEGKKPLSSYLGDFLRNRIVLNCFNMSEEDIKNYIKLLNQHQPAMIRAYADAIYQIARYARENNLKVVPQKVIHTGAGNLFDYMRKEIETVFSCKVFNQYGGREVGHIASECKAHDGLHVFMEHNIVEILDDNHQPVPDGVEGEIIVTNLNNYSMPLIRYRVGDRGIFKSYQPCACGCKYPKLKEVTGRVGDIFRTISGQAVSPTFFAHLIGVVANQKSINTYQVIQKQLDLIVLRIVPTENYSTTDIDFIKSKILDLFGNKTKIEIEIVKKIEKTTSGKYRYTISELID